MLSVWTHIFWQQMTHFCHKILVEKKHRWSLNAIFLPCWNLPPLTSLKLKLFGFVSTGILHQVALSAKLSYHPIWGQPWWNPTFSTTFPSVSWHKWKANTIQSSPIMLHAITCILLEDKIICSADSPLEDWLCKKWHCTLKWEGILNENPNYKEKK